MEKKNAQDYLDGQLLLIDKPLKWTSFQVVNKLRWHIRQAYDLKKIKVGHAGTLDPLATGLLIICTGKMTKQINTFQEQIKIAIDFNKPLYLHQRDSHSEFMKIISEYKDYLPKSVVHCFTGTQSELEDYLDLGFYIGLTGWVCDERRNVELRQSIKIFL